jgi:hypothetical protein
MESMYRLLRPYDRLLLRLAFDFPPSATFLRTLAAAEYVTEKHSFDKTYSLKLSCSDKVGTPNGTARKKLPHSIKTMN